MINMDSFSKEDLSALVERTGPSLVSLYMPTERTGRQVQQNRIRFKNLINHATTRLQSELTEGNPIWNQIEKLRTWEDDDDWWQHQSDGLAIFLDGKEIRRWRIPENVPTICFCSDKFHVRPLCRLQQNDGRFYLLAVSQNELRMFLGTKSSVNEVPDADLPENLRSALNIDEYQKSLQAHSTSRGGDAMFHGHGGSDPDVKKQDEIKQFFHHINDSLNAFFGTERVPLVFAGVEYLFPIFQDTCDYNALVDEPVRGNPDDLSGEQLHEKAWPLVEKLFDAHRQELLEQFGTAVSQQSGSDDLDVVLPAAEQGQVKTLLTVEDEQRWTSKSSESSDAFTNRVSTGEDKINSAVVATLRNGGDVYSVKKNQLDKPIAAIFRFQMSSNQTK
ncbi:baeRF7 domain-containing protein [Bythopirellula polymerisocia]|uniref:Uncharacterized protein n=1 Tax=Bythopirellula polymerisocia TaxID=2528003 RepID=A0A5C6CSV9_9BACT|nr:hypothetical protein [Bythopirellula polymerisocia]TWU27660.1 hypothetical protein Pla144_24370 [Bythopirellula polymerisocia]